MKKALMIASMASMLDNFNTRNINILKELGYQVTLAANFKTEDSNSEEKVAAFKRSMEEDGHRVIHIDFTRKVFNVEGQIKSYRQVRQLAKERFDLVHCHSPICSVITRTVFHNQRKKGTRIIYTAHGFHFYKGAPKTNWLLYYPVEKFLSRWTDVLITINKEDYSRAKKKMKAKTLVYLPGVGVDISKFSDKTKRKNLRAELEIPDDAVWLLSVGEVNKNKNHEIVIRAVSNMENIYYTIAGKGELQEELLSLIHSLGIEKRVKLLGFCKDVAPLYEGADIFVFPSHREGLSVALMEAMASGLPVACSDIRGNTDLIDREQGGALFDPNNVESVKSAIIQLMNSDWEQMKRYNLEKIKSFNYDFVDQKTEKIYGGGGQMN